MGNVMKVFVGALFALAAAEGKKVPPRHPNQRLNKLLAFANEWCDDNLSAKEARNWKNKFARNKARISWRWEKCGFYDEDQLPHGGPAKADRKRRFAGAEDDELIRYDKNNPVLGIKQITTGFAKWARRYISTCKPNQPTVQVDRSTKWYGELAGKWLAAQKKTVQ